MESFDQYLVTLDFLRSHARWSEVETYATGDLAAAAKHPLASQTAITEAKVYAAVPYENSVGPPSSSVHKTAKGLLQKLESVRPSDGETVASAYSVYIWAIAIAHLQLLSGHYKTCIQQISQTAEPDAANDLDYLRAVVIKSRTIMSTAMTELQEHAQAIQTIHSVRVSDHTLKTVPEAARWAEKLYNNELHLTSPGTDARAAALASYARVIQLGNLKPRAEHLPELEAIGHVSSHDAADGTEAGIAGAFPSSGSSTGVNTTTPGDSAADTSINSVASSQVDGIAARNEPSGQVSSSSGSVATSDSSARHNQVLSRLSQVTQTPNGLNSHSSSVGNNPTKLQQQLRTAQTLESAMQAKVAEWRREVSFKRPIHLVFYEQDIERSRQLFRQIMDAIERTFNSVVLMRLLTEVLVSLGHYEEAQAAFDTYVSYQKLQLMREKSQSPGATPDSGSGVVEIFGLMLRVYVSSEILFTGTYEDVDRVSNLMKQLKDVEPKESDAKAWRLAHAIYAGASLFESSHAVGNGYYYNRLEKAGEHFKIALGDDEDHSELSSLTCYAYGQYLAQIKGPSDAFPYIKTAVSRDPEDVRSWYVLVVLLTAQEEYESAQQIAETVLSDHTEQVDLAVTTSIVYKKYLLEMKKAHIAILEARFGIAEALEELPNAVQLVAQLHPQLEESLTRGTAAHTSTASKGVHLERRHTGLGRLFGRSSNGRKAVAHATPADRAAANTESDALLAVTAKKIDAQSRKYIGGLWVWIAQLYTRAELFKEAEQALKEASSIDGVTPDQVVVSGYIASHHSPVLGWKRFSQALSMDPLSLGALLGRAHLLSKHGRVTNGEIDTSSPSVLFEDEHNEMDSYRVTIGHLETLVTRNPGRYTAEAWYFCGVLYEALGDADSAKTALWKSVELEEKSGLRSYWI